VFCNRAGFTMVDPVWVGTASEDVCLLSANGAISGLAWASPQGPNYPIGPALKARFNVVNRPARNEVNRAFSADVF